MAKKLKFTKLPAKKGLGFCDELWAILVKIKHNHRCPICVSEGVEELPELPNAHHLISRRVYKYRFDTDNGIILCPKHHEFGLILSAHTAPWAFEDWMKTHAVEQYQKWVINRNNIESGAKIEYDSIYLALEEEHKSLTGEYYRIERISSYIVFINAEEILLEAKMKNVSASDLSKKYGVTKTAIDKFLKDN